MQAAQAVREAAARAKELAVAALRSHQQRMLDQAAARDALVMQRHQDAKAREAAAREAAERQRKLDLARCVPLLYACMHI